MKGRHTSFQRFGSVLGTTGSVVNKFLRAGKDRDTDLLGKGQKDNSDGKGIYYKTIKTQEENLLYKTDGNPPTPSDPDMGEEIYGCISQGDGATLERIAEEIVKQRNIRREDSSRFKSAKHSWYEAKNGKAGLKIEDCALIPQENIPLVVNSKFPMKYWDEFQKKDYDIPKGHGFTSGALVRPVAFTEKAKSISNATVFSNNVFMYSHELKDVPLETAHAILNRCKEISLTGSLSHVIERTNKQCSGSTSSKKQIKAEKFVGCARDEDGEVNSPCGKEGKCEDQGHTITLTCLSEEKKTSLTLKGDIDITAYRHKQMTKIWGKTPETLEISGNYFSGRPKDLEMSYQQSHRDTCEKYGRDSGQPVKIPPPRIKQIAKLEKQTKLSSGCLTHTGTNKSILSIDLEDNLEPETVYIDGCDEAISARRLTTGWSPPNHINTSVEDSTFHYPSGVRRTSSYTCPDLASGPSLRAHFNGNGWDSSKIGEEEPEDVYTHECKPFETENYPKYKSSWTDTGITYSVEGECPLGLRGVDRFDRNIPKLPSKCDEECVELDNGKLKVVCACLQMCKPYYMDDDGSNPCVPPIPTFEKECQGAYYVNMEIGKYVGVEDANVKSRYYIASVPLLSKMSGKEKENLTLWWWGAVSRFASYDVNGGFASERPLFIFLNKESATKQKPQDNSLYRYEDRECGVLKVACDDWSQEIPLYTVLEIAKETTCKGTAGGAANSYYKTTDAGYKKCQSDVNFATACPGEGPRFCCGKCGGPSNESNKCCSKESCGILDPCGYSIESKDTRDACVAPECNGECKEGTGEADSTCGCNAVENPSFDPDDPNSEECLALSTIPKCAPYSVVSDFKEMGCYGDAHPEDKHTAKINLTLEFKLFEEME